MAYVTADGVLSRKNSNFSLYGILWAIFNFFYLFIQTLTNPDYNRYGNNYSTSVGRPGGGPPRPPSRRFGGFGSSNAPAPPPSGCSSCAM